MGRPARERHHDVKPTLPARLDGTLERERLENRVYRARDVDHVLPRAISRVQVQDRIVGRAQVGHTARPDVQRQCREVREPREGLDVVDDDALPVVDRQPSHERRQRIGSAVLVPRLVVDAVGPALKVIGRDARCGSSTFATDR
jgi:hypothetical protein